MGQRRSENVMVSIEPDLRSILQLALNKNGLTASSYFRLLAISDLKKQGFLTDEMLVKITVG